jgi:hypothetical protein
MNALYQLLQWLRAIAGGRIYCHNVRTSLYHRTGLLKSGSNVHRVVRQSVLVDADYRHLNQFANGTDVFRQVGANACCPAAHGRLCQCCQHNRFSQRRVFRRLAGDDKTPFYPC